MEAENLGPALTSEGRIHPIGRTTFPSVDDFSGLLRNVWQCCDPRPSRGSGNQRRSGHYADYRPAGFARPAGKVARDRTWPFASTVSRTACPSCRNVRRKRPASSPSPFSHRLVTWPARIFSCSTKGSIPKAAAIRLASTSNPWVVRVIPLMWPRANVRWRRRWSRNGWPPRR